jgi:predicted ABC-type ATPase
MRELIAAVGSTGSPLLVILAGSNGAGKSTFYTEALAGIGLPFVNADAIARDISLFSGRATGDLAYEAMHRAEALREELVAQRLSFVMETVLSDTKGAKLEFIARSQAAGYFVLFIHIRLANVQTSIARVAQRVLNGGHDVPDEKLLHDFHALSRTHQRHCPCLTSGWSSTTRTSNCHSSWLRSGRPATAFDPHKPRCRGLLTALFLPLGFQRNRPGADALRQTLCCLFNPAQNQCAAAFCFR